MSSIRRGFGFLGQAFRMAAKDRDLLKPSFYSLAAGALVTLFGSIPILAAGFIWRDQEYVGAVVGVLGALLLFAEYAVAYIFSGMTVRLIYDFLTQGDGRMDQAWTTVRRDLFDLLTLAAVSALVKLFESLLRGKRGSRNALGGLAAGILGAVWTTATYFVLPAMILEDLNLGQALKRATQIIKDNLLLVAVTEIGVGSVVGLGGFLMVLLAAALSAGLFYLIGETSSWSVPSILLGGGLAVLLTGTVVAVVSALSSYATTAYHTCLFVWAREVEQARQRGVPESSVQAPAPVASVL